MKKKTVSIMLAATMALSLFAGCGSSKDTATEDTSKTESTETTTATGRRNGNNGTGRLWKQRK